MKKKPKIITIICYILFLCSLALLFLTDAPTFIFAAVMSLLAAAISTTKKNNIPVLLLLAGGVGLIFPPLSIESRSVWKYPFQRFYTGIYMNIKEPDFFPDSFDNVQGDYRFSYMPSFGQATGHYSIEYTTTKENVQKFADTYSQQARYDISLDEYLSGASYHVNNSDTYDDILTVYTGEIWQSGNNSARIYVFDAVLNFNHPHSSAVIADPETGKIQFTYM